MKARVRYYQQFDADFDRDVPAEAYGSWQTELVEFDRKRIALVVVHANDPGPRANAPGWFRAVEYLPRSVAIMSEHFESLLSTCRNSDVPVIHLAGTEGFHRRYPGYAVAESLSANSTPPGVSLSANEELQRFTQFRRSRVFPGEHNESDIRLGRTGMKDFPEWSRPRGEEFVVDRADRLDAAARHLGATHLVYCGFAVNWCVWFISGGMVDMSRLGYLCSVIEEATTAVENAESAREEKHKQYALWTISVKFGFVFPIGEFVSGIRNDIKDKPCA